MWEPFSDVNKMAKLDDYEIIRELGKGGYGVVYLAKEIATDRLVAIKQMNIDREEDAVLEYDILRNAGCGKGIICYRGIFTDVADDGEKYVFIVSDYYEGEELYNLLDEGEVFSPPEIIYICRRLVKAVKWLHEHGIIHRDIKTENVIITKVGAVLIDFGLSCQIKDAHKIRYSCEKRVGTIETMAPELEYIMLCLPRDQPNPFSEDVYAKADIWALGLVLKSLVEGENNAVQLEEECPSVPSGAEGIAPRGGTGGWPKWLKAWTYNNIETVTVTQFRGMSLLQSSLRQVIEGMLEPDYTKRTSLGEALVLLDEAEKQLSD